MQPEGKDQQQNNEPILPQPTDNPPETGTAGLTIQPLTSEDEIRNAAESASKVIGQNYPGQVQVANVFGETPASNVNQAQPTTLPNISQNINPPVPPQPVTGPIGQQNAPSVSPLINDKPNKTKKRLLLVRLIRN